MTLDDFLQNSLSPDWCTRFAVSRFCGNSILFSAVISLFEFLPIVPNEKKKTYLGVNLRKNTKQKVLCSLTSEYTAKLHYLQNNSQNSMVLAEK